MLNVLVLPQVRKFYAYILSSLPKNQLKSNDSKKCISLILLEEKKKTIANN